MKVQNKNQLRTFTYSTLFFGMCIAWADFGTMASHVQLYRTESAETDYNPDSDSSEEEERIVGGIKSEPHSHPYIVMVDIKTYNETFGCGGSILTSEWILTAGHCIYDAVSIEIRAGKHDVGKWEKTGQKREAIRFVFDIYNDETGENDIAFIKIKPKLVFNEFVKPAKLVDEGWENRRKKRMATVTGWGLTTEDGSAGENLLREVDVPLISNKRCRKWYKRHERQRFSTNLCAGYKKGAKDACQGDSGGPLVIKENGEEIQVGIVSWGEGCARPKQPGVYTRVSMYRPYIKKVTGYGSKTSVSIEAETHGRSPRLWRRPQTGQNMPNFQPWRSRLWNP